MALKKIERSVLLSLVAGLVVCACVITFTGCGGDTKSDVTSQTSKFQVEGNDDKDDKQPDAAPANSKSDPISQPATGTNGEAGSATGADEPPAKPPVIPSTTINQKAPERSFEIPDGPPEAILSFLQELNSVRPASAEEAEKVQAATLKGLDKIIASDGDADIRRTAVMGKISVLEFLIERGKADAEKQLADFIAAIAKDKDPEIARIGTIQGLDKQVKDYINGKSDDFEAIKKQLATVAADKEALPQMVDMCRSAIGQLYGSGKVMDAVAFMKIVGTAMQGHEQLGALADNMLEESALIELVEMTRAGQPEADDALANHFAKMLDGEKITRDDFGQAIGLAQSVSSRGSRSASRKVFALLVEMFNKHRAVLIGAEGSDGDGLQIMSTLASSCERAGSYADAGKIYELIGKSFEMNADEGIKRDAKQIAESGGRRVGLVGKPLELVGLTQDGKPFDWSKYKGKTVLIDFWATWCQPCLAEIPNIEENFRGYHDKGFEVVGVNMDADRADVDHFFEQRKMLWPSIFGEKPEEMNPLVEQCGVETIPFLILINKDGIVEELHVRGERLGEKLAELLGPPAEKPDAAPEKSGDADKTGAAAIAPPADPEILAGGYFVSLCAEDEKEDADDDDKAAADGVNPYLARAGLSVEDLIDFILNMEEKPQSIQRRPGFTAAIVDAADRVLAADAKESLRRIATLSKFAALHKPASLGDVEVDKQLEAFVDQVKDSTDKQVAKEVRFLQLERRAIQSDELTLDEVQELLKELKAYFAAEKLEEKHLRMASSTVHVINRLDAEDAEQKEKFGDMREAMFKEFGELFAKSDNKELSRYGKKLAKSPKATDSDLVGKPLELAGVTADGAAFNWETYRGKVVIVDFWATWCGPCVREMPHLKAFYEKHNADGLEVVGVSLDKDLDALGQFIEENKIAWETLAGEETQPLAEQYGVRGIPTMMLVDQQGQVVAVAHKLDELTAKALELLKKPAA